MIQMQLHQADCRDTLKGMAAESVDLIVTSPPYDDLRTYHDTLIWNFNVFTEIAQELKRVLAPGGVIVWVVNDKTKNGTESGSSFKQALYFKEDLELNLHDTMIYQKDSASFPETTRYYATFEYMFILSKGIPKTFNPIIDRVNKWAGRKKIQGSEYDRRGSRVRRRNKKEYEIQPLGVRYNIWKISTGAGKTTTDKINHPAKFPEKLARDHILSWSNEGDVVMDPMMGSGTVGKMAKLLNRNFIGMEKVESYFIDAKERIENCGK